MRIEEACPNVGDLAKRASTGEVVRRNGSTCILKIPQLTRHHPEALFESDWQPLAVQPEAPSPWGEPVAWEEIKVGEWYLVDDCDGSTYCSYCKKEGEDAWVSKESRMYRFTPPEPPEPVKPPEWLGAVKTRWGMVGFVTRIIDAKTLCVLWQDGTCGQSEIAFDSMTPAPEHHPLKPELAKLFEGGEQ